MNKGHSSNEQFCSICGKIIVGEFGNNAQPVNNGRCCNNCNYSIVIPARIRLANRLENNIKEEI